LTNKPTKITLLGTADSVHLVRWATGLSAHGYDISVITLGDDSIDGVNTINLPLGKSRNSGYLKHLVKVKKLIKELKPDLIHAHYSTGFGLWAYFSKFHPYIVSVWGSDIVSFPDNFVKRIMLKKILSSADAVTATGLYLKEKTIQLYPSLESKITVIPFGAEIPPEINKRKDDRIVRLVYIKGHKKIYGPDILLNAMQKVREVNPKVHLTIAGFGPMTDDLKLQSKQLGLEEYVDFCGFIEHEQISSFLADFDIMVMPSLEESFGVAVLEASAAGLPVIASDVGGVPEVLIHEQTGLLIPSGDTDKLSEAIIRLAENADLRNSMGVAGRKMVEEKYQWELCLDKMAKLYDRLVSEKVVDK